MRSSRSIALVGIVAAVTAASPRPERPAALPNPNVDGAGRLEHGVLSVALEAKESQWIAAGSHQRPLELAAFSEVGKAPLLP
ncbi:MAG TPA: hypothetical protein VGR59_06895, partial [Gemmatimonadaceae bacterium]|nr:hypothetical protein [Gemmatimonadaceae bacterium]